MPAYPGAFGIIVDPKGILKTSDNPDGVISGDIVILSDSIDINLTTQTASQSDQASNIAKLQLSEKFLESIIIKLCGRPGKKGDTGLTGPRGEHGFSDEPRGDKGLKGDNIDKLCKLTCVSYDDSDEITTSAVIDMRLIKTINGTKLLLTKSQLNIDDSSPADSIVSTPLSRTLTYENDANCSAINLDKWTLNQPANDPTPLDIRLLRLPDDNSCQDSLSLNATMSLNDFVSDIVGEYKKRLLDLDDKWGKQAKSHIESIDKSARTILAELTNELTKCEFNLPAVDWAVTIEEC